MKNSFRAFVSILVVVALLFSAAPFAYAEGSTETPNPTQTESALPSQSASQSPSVEPSPSVSASPDPSASPSASVSSSSSASMESNGLPSSYIQPNIRTSNIPEVVLDLNKDSENMTQESSEQDFRYSVNSDGSVTITSYIGQGGTVVIPSEIEGKPVTIVGSSSFSGNKKVTDVTIPDTITLIDGFAFSGCTALKNVSIGSGVKVIEMQAFYTCSSLTEVTIPASVYKIGQWGFAECKNLSTVYMQGRPPTFGYFVFNDCASGITLYYSTSVKIDQNYKSITVLEDYNGKQQASQGAKVTASSKTYYTDANGLVNFTMSSSGTINISKDGYAPISISRDEVASDCVLCLHQAKQTGPYIVSAYAINRQNQKTDILAKGYQVFEGYQDELNIQVNVNWNGVSNGKIKIRQGTTEKVLSGNSTGYFMPGEFFKPGNLSIVLDTGTATTIATKLKIVDLNNKQFEIPAFSSAGITIPKAKITFFDGREYKLEFPSLVLKNEIESDGTYKATEKGDLMQFNLGDNWEVKPQLSVIVEGYIDRDGNNVITDSYFGAGVKAKLSLSKQFVTMIGPFPVPWYLKFNLKLHALVDLYLNSWNEWAGKDLTAQLEVSGAAGVGVKDVVEIGPEIEAEGKATYDIAHKKTNISVEAALNVCLKFWIYEAQFNIAKESWPSDGKNMSAQSLSSSGFKMMDRDYVNQGSVFNANVNNANHINTMDYAGKTADSFKNNVFKTPSQQLIDMGNGKKMMLWIDDSALTLGAVSSRSDSNRTVLMYSVFNGTQWSNPLPVEDDGTADFDLKAVCSNGKVFVVWQDAKEAFNDSTVTPEYMASRLDISTAIFDGTSWGQITNISNNDVSDMMPAISAQGDSAVVSWIVNTDSDPMGQNNKNGVCFSTYSNGSWGPATLTASNLGSVISDATGYLNNEAYTAFIMDQDGDSSTTDDRELYAVKTDGTLIRVTNDDSEETNPVFSAGKLYWQADDSIYDISSIGNNAETISTNDGSALPSEYDVCENGTNKAILWTDTDENNKSQIYGAFYDNTLNQWSDPVLLFETTDRIHSINAFIDSNGNIPIALETTSILTDPQPDGYPYGVTKLCTLTVNPSYNISVQSGTSIDYSMMSPGSKTTIDVPVINNGIKTVAGLTATIKDGSGNVLGTQAISQQIIPGETTDCKISYSLPSTLVKQTINVEMEPTNASDSDPSDNTVQLVIGAPDLCIDKAQAINNGNNNLIVVHVKNNGCSNVNNAVIKLVSGSLDRTEITRQTVNIAAYTASTVTFSCPNTGLAFNDNGQSPMYAVAEPQTDETNTSDNKALVVAQQSSTNAITHTVKFNLEGGTGSISDQTVTEGGMVQYPSNPTYSGKLFAGWYKEAECQNTWKFQTDTVTDDITLFAKWIQYNTDFNNDGSTNLLDLILIAQHYNKNDSMYDLNVDGIVNLFDLMLVAKKIQ